MWLVRCFNDCNLTLNEVWVIFDTWKYLNINSIYYCHFCVLYENLLTTVGNVSRWELLLGTYIQDNFHQLPYKIRCLHKHFPSQYCTLNNVELFFLWCKLCCRIWFRQDRVYFLIYFITSVWYTFMFFFLLLLLLLWYLE